MTYGYLFEVYIELVWFGRQKMGEPRHKDSVVMVEPVLTY
jgi:hypothetical protein